jgi:hypothetical protein
MSEVEYSRNPLMPEDQEGMKGYLAQELDDVAYTFANLTYVTPEQMMEIAVVLGADAGQLADILNILEGN